MRDSLDQTPLMAAVQSGHLEVGAKISKMRFDLKKKKQKKQVVRLLVLAGAHLGLSSVELGILFTSNAGQVDHHHLCLDDPVFFFMHFVSLSSCHIRAESKS